MTERVEQQICIKFYVKLEHSSAETIQMIQKAEAMGNWWLAASSRQCSCSRITSCAEFFSETSNHPGDSAPHSPDLAPWKFLLFPKLKSSLKGKGFQTSNEIRKIQQGSWWRFQQRILSVLWTVEEILGELCEVPRCLLWKELRHHCPTYNVSCILYLLQWMSLIFIAHGWILPGQTSVPLFWAQSS